MLTSLGLAGDLDDVELVEDIEQAFGVNLEAHDVSHCRTVGDLFELVASRLAEGPAGSDRCATAMCFYRLRRALQTFDPHLKVRPDTPVSALRHIPVKSLYSAIRHDLGLRPPLPHLSVLGCISLLCVIILPAGLLISGIVWWAAIPATLPALAVYRLSPTRLPQNIKTVGDLVETVAARSIGLLAAHGARLRRQEAWWALKSISKDHAAATSGDVGTETLLLSPRTAGH